jgi:hypothetical protein
MEELKRQWAAFGQGVVCSGITASLVAESDGLVTGAFFALFTWVALYIVTEIVANYK